MKKIIITDHARQRIEERLGITSEKELEEVVQKAYYFGYTYKEVSRPLQKYMWKRYVQHRKKGYIKLYQDHLFVFKYNILVTVIGIPSYIRTLEKKGIPMVLEKELEDRNGKWR